MTKKLQSKTLGRFMLESVLLSGTVLALLLVMDARRIFAYDDSNNHTGKRWSYFYKFTRTNPVDVMILGNSHAYTGLLPKELSCATGENCFLIASQGNKITDGYYMLREALARTTPKVLVVETYMIVPHQQLRLKGGDLSDQIKSFEARRNLWQKIASAPALFSVDNIPYAWSRTLRNHSYLFDNPELLRYNLRHPKAPEYRDRLYLGRYVRFTEGLSARTLHEYDEKGAPVDGAGMVIDEDCRKAVGKILDLCDRKGVKVLFLTLPMYSRHVRNYDVWKNSLAEVIGDRPWLNLQDPYDSGVFGPECFEDTYRRNQHQSIHGAVASTYKLADYLKRNFPDELRPRFEEKRWRNVFYGEDGWYDNLSPAQGDRRAYSLCQGAMVGGVRLKEICCVAGAQYNQAIVKALKDSVAGPPEIAFTGIVQDAKGNRFRLSVSAFRDKHFYNPDYEIYRFRVGPDEMLVGAEP